MASKQFNSVDGYSVGSTPISIIDANANITAVALTANGNASFTGANVSLGAVGNLKITGGSSGLYLQTDGSGNLSWQTVSVSTASISNGNSNVNIPAANGNIQVSVAGVANVITFASNNAYRGSYGLTGAIFQANTAPASPQPGDQWYNTFNGILFEYLDDGTSSQWVDIGSIPYPNVIIANASAVLNNVQTSGTYYPAFISSTANGNYSLNSNTAFSANIANGALIATTFVGALSGAATTAGTVTTAAQPNITSVGTLTTLGVNGTVTAVAFTANTGVFTGNGSGLSAIAGANVSGQVSFAATANAVAGANVTGTVSSATTAGTVTTAAQPNITSVGTLTSLTVSGGANLASLSGNVGIGTTSPAAKLHVKGSNQVEVLETTVSRGLGQNYLTYKDPSGDKAFLGYADSVSDTFYVYNALNSAMTLSTNALERMRIDGSGNVGIGTTSPAYKLDVTGQGRATTGWAVSTDGSAFTPSGLNAIPNYGTGYITSTAITTLAGFGGISAYTNQLERMRIDSGGNVGIGTSSPASILHTVASGSEIRSENNNTGQYQSGRVRLKGPAGTYRSTNIVHGNDNAGGTNTYFAIEGADSSDNYLQTLALYNYASQYWGFSTNSSEKMRITSSGNVGIGNTAPAHTLSVTGTAAISSSLQVANITTGANTTAGSITGNWTLTAGSRLQATYADIAEKYVADDTYEPGTVLMFGGEQEVTLATTFDSTKVAGVVTTNPAYSMNAVLEAEHVAEIALQGRVPCKVIGPIEKGDLMVSAINGHAIANNEARAGTIIGKALENFTGELGIIEVAVGRF